MHLYCTWVDGTFMRQCLFSLFLNAFVDGASTTRRRIKYTVTAPAQLRLYLVLCTVVHADHASIDKALEEISR